MNITKDIGEPGDLGGFNYPIPLALLLSWIVVFLCLMKGVKSSGKVRSSITFALPKNPSNILNFSGGLFYCHISLRDFDRFARAWCDFARRNHRLEKVVYSGLYEIS